VALAHLSNDTVRFSSFLFTMAITLVSLSEFNLLKCSRFLNSLELLGNRKSLHLSLRLLCLQSAAINKNHRCQCKQMHGNYFRITMALCHLMAVFCYILIEISYYAFACRWLYKILTVCVGVLGAGLL